MPLDICIVPTDCDLPFREKINYHRTHTIEYGIKRRETFANDQLYSGKFRERQQINCVIQLISTLCAIKG